MGSARTVPAERIAIEARAKAFKGHLNLAVESFCNSRRFERKAEVES
jgi:hypothetical protein